MTYKAFDPADRTALVRWLIEQDMPEQKKGQVLHRLYEEYRITHLMYEDVHEFIESTTDEDLQFTVK